jgi:hypothetical protein
VTLTKMMTTPPIARNYATSVIDVEMALDGDVQMKDTSGTATGGSVPAEASGMPPEATIPEDKTTLYSHEGKLYRSALKGGTEVNTNWSLGDVQEYARECI